MNTKFKHSVLEFQDDPFGHFPADARNSHQPFKVPLGNGSEQITGGNPGKDINGKLRTYTVDRQQKLKNIPLFRGMKSEKIYSILLYMCMNIQSNRLTGIGKFIEGRQGNKNTIPNSVGIHNHVCGRFIYKKSANPGNHIRWVAPLKNLHGK